MTPANGCFGRTLAIGPGELADCFGMRYPSFSLLSFFGHHAPKKEPHQSGKVPFLFSQDRNSHPIVSRFTLEPSRSDSLDGTELTAAMAWLPIASQESSLTWPAVVSG